MIDFSSPREQGALLSGANNETRALMLGTALLADGSVAIDDSHARLRELGYNTLHRIDQSQLRTLALGLAPELYDTGKLEADDVLDLTEEGILAACFAGELITKILVPHNINALALVGGHKTKNPVGPMVRREVYKLLVAASERGLTQLEVARELSVFGTPLSSTRSQLDRLENVGIVAGTRKNPKRKVILPNRRTTVTDYLSLCDNSLGNPNPDYMRAILTKGSDTARYVPFLVKRAVIGSGKTGAFRIEELNTELRDLYNFLPSDTILSTSEIAFMLGRDMTTVKTYLDRVTRSLGSKAAVNMLALRGMRRERLWGATPRTDKDSFNLS